MRKNAFFRVLAVMLCILMLVGTIPMSAFAASYDTAVSSEYYNVLSKKDYVLCDGAIESEIVLNNDDASRRQVLHVIEVDPNNPNVSILPSYYGIDKDLTDSSNWVAKTMIEQANYYVDELDYNIVGGMNTALAYDSEAPISFMVYNGEVLADNTVHPTAQTYLAVTKNEDGTVECELRSTSEKLHGDEWQAVSCNFGFVIKDGKLTSSTVERTSAAADRSMIGIKEDGTLVICQAEGRNAPYAVGLSSYEIGETMLSLGCKWAVNGDGGGSSTFVTKREGESDITLRNIPSDGTPRATINGILVASNTKATGEFDHVSMLVENDYITPGTSIDVEIKGVDASGSSAELPETGLTYTATNGTFENGVFTSDGTVGEAVVTAYYNDVEVGSVTINVVVPTSIAADSESMVIPYSKTVSIGVTAYYGDYAVIAKAADYSVALDNTALGTVNGLEFTATSEELENNSGVFTITSVHNTALTATVEVSLGKGSEILYDFEDQDLHGFYRSTNKNYNYNCAAGETGIVDATTGKVRNGNYAMKVEVDFSNSLEAGYQLGTLVSGESKYFSNAKTIGMWLYIPDEAVGLRIDPSVQVVDENGTYKSATGGQAAIGNVGETSKTEVGFVYGMEESGWRYITIDLSTYEHNALLKDYAFLKFYISQKDGKNNYYYGDQSSVNGKYTFYIDDITVDYSSAVDDREEPIFSSVTYVETGADTAGTVLAKDTSAGYEVATTTLNNITFAATVAENTTKTNYTGLNTASGKVYIDGVDCSDKLAWAGNKMMVDANLSDGYHQVKFAVCDKAGNYSSVVRYIVVNSADAASVKVVAKDAEADRILLGSLYYVDVVADAVEKINSVDVTLDLNNISTWELDHMEVAAGFSAEYTLTADENIANIKITKTGNVTATGETALVSIPTRTWQLAPTVAIYGHAGQVWMYPNYKAGNEILPMDLSVETDSIVVTYTDNTTDTFVSPTVQVDTELSGNAYTSSGSAANNYIRNEAWYASWNGGHDHRVETAQYYAEGATNVATPVAVEDKAATCTEAGYTGRTYCETCASVVDWGETIPATGHTYVVKDGYIKCEDCDAVTEQSGIVELDGNKYYSVAGKLATGWIVEGSDYYYFDTTNYAAMTDGRYLIDKYYYSFDENGVLTKGQFVRVIVNGEFKTRYIFAGKFTVKSFVEVDGNTYWFGADSYMAVGTQVLKIGAQNKGTVYVIDENGVIEGVLQHTGAYNCNGTVYYLVDGKVQATTGIFEKDGNTYFCNNNNGILSTGKVYVDTAYATDEYPVGWYYFDELGALCDNEFFTADGVSYYIVNGQPVTGVFTVENETYYAIWNGEVQTGKVYITESGSAGQLTDGYYYFNEAGKMYNEEYATVDGKLYYMVNGQPKKEAGVIELDGELFYIYSDGTMATGKVAITETTSNGLLDAGNYYFAADGSLADEEFIVVNSKTYYAVDGKLLAESGVTEIAGDLYCLEWNGSVRSGKIYITEASAKGVVSEGWYYTDENGKFYNNEFTTIDDSNYYMIKGQPMVQNGVVDIEGDLYCFQWDGAIRTGKIYVTESSSNGVVTSGWHYTDETGRFYNAEFTAIDDSLFYMIEGKPMKQNGVVEIDGNMYCCQWNGAVRTGKIYVTIASSNDIIESGWYYTDETGRFYDNEIASFEGVNYYFVDGKPAKSAGVVEVDGAYYCCAWDGSTRTGKIYVTIASSNGIIESGWYYTDETGRFYDNEFVEIEGDLYYMVDGSIAKLGVFELNGDLYFADKSNGRIARDGRYYVTINSSNGIINWGFHTFDENGKMTS